MWLLCTDVVERVCWEYIIDTQVSSSSDAVYREVTYITTWLVYPLSIITQTILFRTVDAAIVVSAGIF